MKCPVCDGKGKLYSECARARLCPKCNGKKEIEEVITFYEKTHKPKTALDESVPEMKSVFEKLLKEMDERGIDRYR